MLCKSNYKSLLFLIWGIYFWVEFQSPDIWHTPGYLRYALIRERSSLQPNQPHKVRRGWKLYPKGSIVRDLWPFFAVRGKLELLVCYSKYRFSFLNCILENDLAVKRNLLLRNANWQGWKRLGSRSTIFEGKNSETPSSERLLSPTYRCHQKKSKTGRKSTDVN